MKDRYAVTFDALDQAGKGAFVPFVVIGDPDLEQSLQVMHTLADSGADALELGFPFSDPLADGPTIQAAMTRALEAGGNAQACFDLLKSFRTTNVEIPIGLLVYANIVHAFGIDAFYRECQETGVDSVLVADVPVAESAEFCESARAHQVAPILLCPPNVDDLTLQTIAEKSSGYIYLLSRAGVTGTNVAAGMPVESLLEKLKQHDAAPPLLGFGISRPEHVRKAISAGAKGVIVGSAIVQIIQKNMGDVSATCEQLAEFAREMKSAT